MRLLLCVCVFQSINYLVIQIWMLAEMHHTRSTCTDEANAASIVTRYDAMANAAFHASNVQPRASNAPHIYLYLYDTHYTPNVVVYAHSGGRLQLGLARWYSNFGSHSEMLVAF